MGSKSDFLLGGSWHPVIEWAEEPEIDPEELAKVFIVICLLTVCTFVYCYQFAACYTISIGFQITIAFVGNLPKDANEDYLKKLFGPFGKV